MRASRKLRAPPPPAACVPAQMPSLAARFAHREGRQVLQEGRGRVSWWSS